MELWRHLFKIAKIDHKDIINDSVNVNGIDATPRSQLADAERSLMTPLTSLLQKTIWSSPRFLLRDMHQDGISSDLMLSDLHFESIAPTLQDDFALPGCLDRLEMKLRFPGLDAPRISPITTEWTNQAAIKSS